MCRLIERRAITVNIARHSLKEEMFRYPLLYIHWKRKWHGIQCYRITEREGGTVSNARQILKEEMVRYPLLHNHWKRRWYCINCYIFTERGGGTVSIATHSLYLLLQIHWKRKWCGIHSYKTIGAFWKNKMVWYLWIGAAGRGEYYQPSRRLPGAEPLSTR